MSKLKRPPRKLDDIADFINTLSDFATFETATWEELAGHLHEPVWRVRLAGLLARERRGGSFDGWDWFDYVEPQEHHRFTIGACVCSCMATPQWAMAKTGLEQQFRCLRCGEIRAGGRVKTD
jgi:hypothetical protein